MALLPSSRMRLLLFLSLGAGLFSSWPSQATVTLRAYSTYLRNSTVDPTTNEVTIHAARTLQNGVDCTMNNPSFTDSSAPCNSCAKLAGQALSSPLPCNEQEVHPSLPFSVTLSSSDAADYTTCTQPIVFRRAGDTGSIIAAPRQTTVTPGVANQDVTATFTWTEICGNASSSGSAGCDRSFDTKFEFGFDRNCNQTALSSTGAMMRIRFRYVIVSPAMTLGCLNAGPYEGICSYTVSPGDQKVFVKNIDGTANDFLVPDLTAGASDTTDASQMKYAAFRVYYRPISDGAPASMTFSDPHQDLGISGESLLDGRVTGLSNGTEYLFWGAMVDQAGTVTHFPPLASLTNDQVARPEEVFGVLDQKGCFIATAAFGTEQAKEIQVLRDFRDVHLARTPWGRSLIRFYYRNSPQWAAVIRDHEILRGMVRVALGPVIGVADLSLRHGAWVFYGSLLGFASVLGAGLFFARGRGHGKAGRG